MKNIFGIIIIMFCISCSDDFIDLAPISNLNSSDFYKDDQDINQAVLSAYAGLRSIYNTSAYRLGEIRSDNTGYGWLAGNPANELQIDEFATPLLEDNGHVESLWNNGYNVILRANIVIGRADQADFVDEKLKNQYIAEARFIRSLTYFWLNRAFGGFNLNNELSGVIKVTSEITPNEAYEFSRSSLKDIYDLIVDDLKFAISNLPLNYSASNIGRATQGSAIGLLGKVYMFMAGYPMKGGEEYYNLAIDQFIRIIDGGLYSLVPSYKDLFDVNNKNTPESLFEIQYKKGSPGGETGSPWNNRFAPRFSEKEVAAVGDKGGENTPTGNMSRAYEFGDPRKYVSMRDGYISQSSGNFMNDRYVSKYFDVSSSGSDNGNNWIELRLADIYLLYAEAIVRTKKDKSIAIDLLNKIRERARNTPGDPDISIPIDDLLVDYELSDFTDDESLLFAIENERRVELAFENHRWFDLVRTERAKEIMINEQKEDGYPEFTWDDSMLFYPIPRSVMLSNPGFIIQNKGYTQL